jgi:hypothetical protein
MKIIFLDVDGVLNRCQFAEQWPNARPCLEADLIFLLQKILTSTDARIVISSTWRKHSHLMKFLKTMLGPQFSELIIGATPVMEFRSGAIWCAAARGQEIQQWFNSHPEYAVDQFIILDDMNDMQHLTARLLRTHWPVGLTPELADEAIRILNSNNQTKP